MTTCSRIDNDYIMRQLEDRYISLLTDFGFKRIFGTKPNKELLINFLNSLFNGEQVIKEVTYLSEEHLGEILADRKAIFDVYCENEKGEKFIVEMQNAYQKYFKDRSLFYSTTPIREQASKGKDWDFRLKPVYVIALLNFDLKDEAFESQDITHTVGLLDTKTYKVFNRNLTFKFVEISKFNKKEDELDDLFDKWLYVLRNLSYLDNRPKALKGKIFTKLFEEAEIARFTPSEYHEYEDSLKAYRDIKNSIDTALADGIQQGFERGLEQGMQQGLEQGMQQGLEQGMQQGMQQSRIEMAKKMLAFGMPIKEIAAITGLSEGEVENCGN